MPTITEAVVKAAAPGFVRDDRLIGFGLRTTPAGAKSFIVECKVAGRSRRFVIGRAGRLTVAEARELGRKLLSEMAQGKDPQARRRAQRQRSDTLEEQLDAYIAAKAVKASTAAKYRATVRRCLDDWRTKPIADITPQMTRLRYEELLQHSIAEANNAMRVLRAVARRAMVVLPDREDGTPIMRVVPTAALAGQWKKIARRTRLLEPSEVPAWWVGLHKLRSEDSRKALITLLLTGLRLNEALDLQWSDVHEGMRQLTVKDSKTGGFVKYIGPELAVRFAAERPPRDCRVFAVKDLRAALDSVRENGGKEINAHDLRRTFASFAERAGVPHTALKVLLNHALGGDVTVGYVQPSADDMRHWAARVEQAILAAAAGDSVVPIRRTA
jgi:integrase